MTIIDIVLCILLKIADSGKLGAMLISGKNESHF